ncbi:hypothetical protein PQO03_02575 [Lentisphaera profundi]|uniref:Arm DNA-binding domain-containing protein n=1 Tax=Lentisphaera profundi TaxID=1658616 RepID=A0ABY7VRL9_9BACT|nr:hypothetical protein [Lentisphaera profundi]WDE96845.1 hypothetical protein PQO03_02575 [Lentisphaera profundi]
MMKEKKLLIEFINNYTRLKQNERGHVMPLYRIDVYSKDGEFKEKVNVFKWRDEKTRHITPEDEKLIDEIMKKQKTNHELS